MKDQLLEKDAILPPDSQIEKTPFEDEQMKNKAWLASILLQKGQKVWQRFMAIYQTLRALPRQTRRLLNKKLAITTAQIALMMALSGAPIYANNIAVTITDHVIDDSDGECSLAEAIITANVGGQPYECDPGDPAGPDTIQLPPNATFNINYAMDYSYGPTGLPSVTSDITIEGNGSTIQGIQPAPRGEGGGAVPFRLMSAYYGNLTIDNATLTGGSATADPGQAGGAIYGYASTVTITNTAVISGNTASGNGGGIALFSVGAPTDVQISNSTVSGNTSLNGSGGGIFNYNVFSDANINIVDSNITNNQADGVGGAVSNSNYFATSNLDVTNSTISGNSGFVGGALNNFSYYGYAQLAINESTVSGNSASGPGGAILNAGYYSGTVTIENNSQILNNESYYSSGGAVANFSQYSANVAIQSGSVISGNQASMSIVPPGEVVDGELPPPPPPPLFFATGGGAVFNSNYVSPFGGRGAPAGLDNNQLARGNRGGTAGFGNSQQDSLSRWAPSQENLNPQVADGKGNPYEAVVTLNNSTITGNSTNGTGGGISNVGYGLGAVYAENDAFITNNTANNNVGTGLYGHGGGVYNITVCDCPPIPFGELPTGNLENSNELWSPQGGPSFTFGQQSVVHVDSSTISGNIADANGGGIYNYGNGRAYVTLLNGSTVTANAANGNPLPAPVPGFATARSTNHGNKHQAAAAGEGGSDVGFGGGISNDSYYLPGPPPGATIENAPSRIEGPLPVPYGFSQLLVDNSTITGNTSLDTGGGVANHSFGIAYSNVRNNATFYGNTSLSGYGGGLSNFGYVNLGITAIIESTISGNQAASTGGGVDNFSVYGFAGSYLGKSTVSGNSAEDGGGVWNGSVFAPSSAYLSNSTVSGNSASQGGGIFNYYGNVTLEHATVTNNSASTSGGGIYNYDGTVNLSNSIVAANPTGGDCNEAVTTGGFNLDSDGSCITNGVNNDITAADPMLGPLQVNLPGSTATHALLAGSPAIDAIPSGDPACSLVPDDQRGIARPQQDGCDIGAYERQIFSTFLPVILNNPMPDLVITELNVAEGNLSVTIENQGTRTITEDFWVDLYLDPSSAPTAVNEVWKFLSTYGAAWGVTQNLAPGDSLTLTLNDTYYDPTESNMPTEIPAGTVIYAQVDAAHVDTAFGGVLENHELNDGTYNNISGPETTDSPITVSIQKTVANIKGWLGLS